MFCRACGAQQSRTRDGRHIRPALFSIGLSWCMCAFSRPDASGCIFYLARYLSVTCDPWRQYAALHQCMRCLWARTMCAWLAEPSQLLQHSGRRVLICDLRAEPWRGCRNQVAYSRSPVASEMVAVSSMVDGCRCMLTSTHSTANSQRWRIRHSWLR